MSEIATTEAGRIRELIAKRVDGLQDMVQHAIHERQSRALPSILDSSEACWRAALHMMQSLLAAFDRNPVGGRELACTFLMGALRLADESRSDDERHGWDLASAAIGGLMREIDSGLYAHQTDELHALHDRYSGRNQLTKTPYSEAA